MEKSADKSQQEIRSAPVSSCKEKSPTADQRPFFSVQAEDPHSSARCGCLGTGHGSIDTPAFMPVGTRATIKAVPHPMLMEDKALNYRLILANAYHLYIRPGIDVIEQAGGLHAFMNWRGGLLTDSGGYQVFSLASQCEVHDDGVRFQAALDGSTHQFSPESVIDLQRALGADLIMPLDECLSFQSSERNQEKALHRTQHWYERSLAKLDETMPRYGHPQWLLPILQGGLSKRLRKEAARQAASMPAPGYAIGGLSVGEPAADMYRVLEWVIPWLDKEKPRYLMGVGTPANLLESIARGIDLFDCVLPTRNARNAMLFTSSGTLNMRNAQWRYDQRPIDEKGPHPVSRYYRRSYLRHLFMSHEQLGAWIASVHNLAFYASLMRDARTHLQQGTYSAWMKDSLSRLSRPAE